MNNLFTNLNRESTRKIRTVQPKKVILKTDTSHFGKIHTDRVETIISNTRKAKENEIQKWIIQYNPGPFEILKRISEISLPHRNLLSKIIPELEEIASIPHPPAIVNNSRSKITKKHISSSIQINQPENQNKNFNSYLDYDFNSDTPSFYDNSDSQLDDDKFEIKIKQLLNHDPYTNSYALSNSKDMKTKLADILIESHDNYSSIMEKKERISKLEEILKAKKEEKEKLQHDYEDFQYLLEHEKFGDYDFLKKEKKEQEEIQNFEKERKRKFKKQDEYSQLYGESRHLRDNIQKLVNDVNENHEFQLSFAHNSALKKIDDDLKKQEEEEERIE